MRGGNGFSVVMAPGEDDSDRLWWSKVCVALLIFFSSSARACLLVG